MENINVKKEYEEYIQNKLKKDGENNESEELSVTAIATEKGILALRNHNNRLCRLES